MSTPTELMAAGLAALVASQIGTGANITLTASGTTKANGLQLKSGMNVFTVVSSGKAMVLPPAGGSAPVLIVNGGANSGSLFSSGTDVINALTAGAAFTVTNAKIALFFPAGNRWAGGLFA